MGEMTEFFTSDMHIGDAMVAQYRGFNDLKDYEQTLARRWDSVVGDDDIVWVLGDVSGGGPHPQYLHALDWISDRTGTKHLISGNHDRSHPMRSPDPDMMAKYSRVFASVGTTRPLPEDMAVLSHFPYEGEGWGPDRYTAWRLPDEGVPVIHGHTHRPEIITYTRLGTPQIHVGVDAHHLRPVPVSRVLSYLAEAVA